MNSFVWLFFTLGMSSLLITGLMFGLDDDMKIYRKKKDIPIPEEFRDRK